MGVVTLIEAKCQLFLIIMMNLIRLASSSKFASTKSLNFNKFRLIQDEFFTFLLSFSESDVKT